MAQRLLCVLATGERAMGVTLRRATARRRDDMTRHWIGIALLAACLSCSSTGGPSYMGFAVGTSYAPGPPRFYFDRSPHVTLVAGTDVWMVDDPAVNYDMFQYGSRWYVYANDYWYTSPRYDGPYRTVDVRYVPREVISVPSRDWRDHPHGRGHGRTRNGHDRGNHNGWDDDRGSSYDGGR
jgi:hypothetical protein